MELMAQVGQLEAPGLAPEHPLALGQALAVQEAVLADRAPLGGQGRAPPPALLLLHPLPVPLLQPLEPVAVTIM